jgi:thioredoxin reductase (NADPH)
VQARRFGVEIITPLEVKGVRIEGPYRILNLSNDSEISSHTIIIAVGLAYNKLDVPGVEELTGRGVYYGASMTEANFCTDQGVMIVGAGNSAGQAALYLAKFASKVTILVRGESLGQKMSQYLVQRIEALDNIVVRVETEVAGVKGEGHLESVAFRNRRSGEEETEQAVALFIFIGAQPCTDWLKGVVEMDERGFVLSGPQLMENSKLPASWPMDRQPFLLETSVPGIFVVGDVRSGSVKRVASAVGEGSIAVQFVHQYLAKVK